MKRKRSSIGISTLSKSRVSTPKSTKKAKFDVSNSLKPLMPKLLNKDAKVSFVEPATIVLDETDEGIVEDASTKSSLPHSPDIEILTVKISQSGTKKVKASKKAKNCNPQKIFSKFNLPNPVYPKNRNYIPLNDKKETTTRRNPNEAKGYKFDPKAKPNIKFAPLAEQKAGQVYQFEATSGYNGSSGNQRCVIAEVYFGYFVLVKNNKRTNKKS